MPTTIKPLQEKNLFALSAHVIDSKPHQTTAIIRRNGINVPESANKKDIDKAFGILFLKSPSFRKDFSKLAAQSVKDDNKAQQLLNADGQSYFLNETGPDDTTNKTENKNTKSWQDYFTPELVGSLLKTAADTASVKIKGKAGSTGTGTTTIQTKLDEGRTGNGTPAITINNPGSDSKGIGTGAIIAISVGSLALLGTALYFVFRKK